MKLLMKLEQTDKRQVKRNLLDGGNKACFRKRVSFHRYRIHIW